MKPIRGMTHKLTQMMSSKTLSIAETGLISNYNLLPSNSIMVNPL